MPDPVAELIGEWLARAEHDLRVAEFLLTMPDPPRRASVSTRSSAPKKP